MRCGPERQGTARLAALAALALAAGCAAAPDTGREAPAAGAGKPPASVAAAPALPAPGAEVPHVYMALQPGGPGRPHSVVFAIDAARDGTPGDDPAIRLTPEAGRCNPQEMRRYDFSAEAAGPVVSEAEGASGLTARDLPAFLAA
ncbi:MAG TPA: hypothetical protein VMM59_13290, partial [Thermohalobaculum sp.]|nr:hypothetical protein [Thermohalobaculum sp.]